MHSLTVFGTPDNFCQCAMVRDADWLDPLPVFLAGGVPRDLTGMHLTVWVRPTYDWAAPLLVLSTQTGTIILDDPVAGLASIAVPRDVVIASLPAGDWDWFCVMTDPGDGTTTELFRGGLSVHDGRVT